MTMYAAAEFHSQEDVELPEELEDVLIGMVNEVAGQRTTFNAVSQACQANIPMSKKSQLRAVIQKYLKLRDDMEVPAGNTPGTQPRHETIADTVDQESVPTQEEDPYSNPQEDAPYSNPQEDAPYSNPQEEVPKNAHEEDTYANLEDLEEDMNGCSVSNKSQTASKSEALEIDDGYSNADELQLSQNYTSNPRKPAINDVKPESPTSHDTSSCSSDPDNPYGTAMPRPTPEYTCSHTEDQIKDMYSTVQKIRNDPRPTRSGSGRVEGHRLDTTISPSSDDPILQTLQRKNGKPVIVQLPSNKKFQIPANKDDTVRNVFKFVIKRLAVEDSSLFGLMYSPTKGIWEFMPQEHRLKQYAPDKWKSDTASSPAVQLRLSVKYFPPGPHKFVNPITRLQFFLNIRNRILDGTYQISKEAAYDLAALSLQADLGNYYDQNVSGNQYFDPHCYIPPDVMSAVSYQYVSKEIPMLHSKLDDMSQNEAVLRYLQIASQLPDYGIHFFEVKEPDYHETQHTTIGVSLLSLHLYEKSTDTMVERGEAQQIAWNKILNISYKNKTFILDVSYVKKNKTKSQRRYNFVTENTKVSRMIMTLCADTHKFYLKLKNMLPKEEELEPTFSVRDYTPSPRSVITNSSPVSSPTEEDAPEARKKVINRSDSVISKRPPPNNKLQAKYVCLTKKDSLQSLGMTIIGGDGTHGIYVDRLTTGGLANLDGRIKKGDMLLSVNGSSLKNMTHKEAVDLITRQPCRVELELVETSGDIPYELAGSEAESTQSLEIDSSRMQRPPSLPNSKPPLMMSRSAPAAAQRYSTSKPDDNSSLPVSLQNRLAMQERYNLVRQPQQQTTATARGINSAPAQRAKFQEQRRSRASSEHMSADQDSAMGDSSVYSTTESTALPLNFHSIESDMSDNNDKSNKKIVTPTRDPFSRIFTVYLTKKADSLGFSIRVEKGVVYVRDVFANGPAAKSGMIEKGDALLSVNGCDLTDMTNQEVMHKLQQAPSNVTLVMSWGRSPNQTHSKASDRVGMQFRVILERGTEGFGFTTRSTYMGSENFARIKSLAAGGPAACNGCLEEGDILLTINDQSVENTSEKLLSDLLSTVESPARFLIYRPDTIRTFNPRKFETGTIMPVQGGLQREELLNFCVCAGYPYYASTQDVLLDQLRPNDRLLRVGKMCCQGIKQSQLQSIADDVRASETLIFRPCDITDSSGHSTARPECPVDVMTITNQLMDKAETIILQKKEHGLGFSLLGQQDGKRIVHGVTVKTVLTVGAAYEEGRLAPGDLIVMVNGRSMVGITQSKALSTIRKSSGEVVLTVVPGPKRDPHTLTVTERRLIGNHPATPMT